MRARYCEPRQRKLGAVLAATVVAAAMMLGLPGAQAGVGPNSAAEPSGSNDARSLLGSYLAGRVARGQNDTEVAARYYREALTHDPDNEVLVEQTFLMETSEGNWKQAVPLSRRLVGMQPQHRTAHAFVGIVDFADGKYEDAEKHFIASSANPIGELTSTLSRAWNLVAQGKAGAALALLDSPKQPEWAQYYLRYHRAVLADVAGNAAEARAAWERVPKTDLRSLRITLAYARHLAVAGDKAGALAALKAQFEKSKAESHPLVRALYSQIEAGRKVPLLIGSPTEGMAEVYYGLGEALTGEGSVGVGAIYLQFALFLVPDHPYALATLASAYEATKRYRAAIDAYERIPRGTPMQASLDIRRALNLGQLEETDAAQKLLERVAKEDPKDIRPLDALGGLMRNQKRFAEAVEYYSRAIALIDKPEARHWTYFYSRGTSYERLKKMNLAEADLKKSLQLSPDQPMVLNYLGYTWIDQNRNLKEGLGLIEKAVRQKPDDGYIVDSLGWAYYRLGRFQEATKQLERAVELRPEDPVLNDHLGDAFWRVGREREARFQWEQALTLNPEAEDAEKIRTKLQKGLAPASQAKQVKKTREVQQRKEAPKKSSGLFPIFE
ncbi:MAG: tetratricopeptide repeat protein [Hyphomicrobiaceae bacterium]|nr:tetratricopeptide repeat protein [Hyphomicrobiaceae bacterium]